MVCLVFAVAHFVFRNFVVRHDICRNFYPTGVFEAKVVHKKGVKNVWQKFASKQRELTQYV